MLVLLSNSPSGSTWHRSQKTSVFELAEHEDHKHNSGIYHPNGNGGRDIWFGGILGRLCNTCG